VIRHISPIGARGRSTPTLTARVTPSTERPASPGVEQCSLGQWTAGVPLAAAPFSSARRALLTGRSGSTGKGERHRGVDDGIASRPEHPELAAVRVELELRAQDTFPGWAPNLDGCGASADWALVAEAVFVSRRTASFARARGLT
jgi:hypothetical protein